MKKTLRLMGLCALAMLALTGCKKEQNNGNMTFKAKITQPTSDTRTEIDANNDLVWSDGDMIKVYTAAKAGATFTISGGQGTTEATFNGTLEASESYTAIYPATNVDVNTDGNIEFQLSGTQTFVNGNFTTDLYPMYATSTDGNFTFHSPCGILALQLKGNATIGSIELTDSLGMDLAGTFELTGADVNFHDTQSGVGILLGFGANGLTLDANTATLVYFVVPEGAFAGGFKADVKGTDGNRIILLETSTPNTITAEYIHLMPEVTVNASTPAPAVPEGAINGLFSVSATRQVYFSQGNLQYQASTNTWQFAEHQYDYVGLANSSISQTNSGWIDLFGWGTSGYNHGAIAYQPWSTSISNDDYRAYRHPAYDLDNSTGQADWGYNPISNGGNTENSGWRTLDRFEWYYVFNIRSTTSGIWYAKATVNGVRGVILLPDNWTATTYALSNWNNSSADFTSNTISAADWANVLEANGAVFLPAAGFRFGTSLSGVDSNGFYWSTMHCSDYTAYDVEFGPYNLNAYTGYIGRRYGQSVRLVRNAE